MSSWFRTTDRFRDPVGALRIAQFASILSRFPVGHLVDLGAGHGIFARVAAGLGWRVTAVDARDERYPDDDRVQWVVSDVRAFDDYADADVVCCLGLWYHLTLDDQRELARRVAPRPLIIDTHVATPTLPPYQLSNERLSDLVTEDGFTGRVYDEGGLESRPTASWGNTLSFWPSVASLETQLYQGGYEVVEQISPPSQADRGYFVARMIGDDATRDRIEALVTQFDPMIHPEAPAHDRPLHSLAAAVVASEPAAAETLAPTAATPAPEPRAPESTRPKTVRSPARLARPAKPPTVKQASAQLAGAVSRSVRHRLGKIGRAS